MPDSLEGLQTAGPYAVLSIATAMAWGFNRGRAFVVAATLLGAFAVNQLWRGALVYQLLVVLVPLNLLAAMVWPERGARYRASYGWLALLGAEALLLAWAHKGDGGADFIANPMPIWGRLAFAAAFAATVWRAWPEFTALQVGNASALAAFFIASVWVQSPSVYSAFMAAGGVILMISLLAESHRLAFRDTLTGLPGRRALEERLRSLGGRFAIAMVDVDHFKKFNDTHGHDIGDQVLAGGGAPRRGGRRRHRLPLRRRGVQRAVPGLDAGGGAAASRGDPRLDRGLQDGGARARPAEVGRGGQQAARRRGEKRQLGEAPVGDGFDRRVRAEEEIARRGAGDQGGG